MKTNLVKQKLREGKPSFGTWMTLGHLQVARLLARSGFDWLTLDMEHAPLDWSQAAAIFGAVADSGCVPLVRVPEGDHYCIKRALDAGAWGIVVPMVNTVDQARTAIAAAKYPPQGNRSVGGTLHALNYGAPVGEYFERANDEILVILQTESPTGVANAEEIYRLPGCDGIFVGPVDLRFNMRTADGRKPTDEEHEAMIQRVIAAGKKAGCPTGIHVMDPAVALKRAEQGMQFIAIGSDLHLLNTKTQEVAGVLWPERTKKDLARY